MRASECGRYASRSGAELFRGRYTAIGARFKMKARHEVRPANIREMNHSHDAYR